MEELFPQESGEVLQTSCEVQQHILLKILFLRKESCKMKPVTIVADRVYLSVPLKNYVEVMKLSRFA